MQKLLKYLKYPLMGFLVWYLIQSGRLDIKPVLALYGLKTLPVLAGVFVLLLIVHFLFSARYRIVLDVIGYKSKLSLIFNIIMVGVFYNNFFPGGVGGDVVRVYYVKKKLGTPIPQGAAATLLDRGVGMLGLAFVSLSALALMSLITQNDFFSEYRGPVLIAFLICMAALFCLFLMRVDSFYNFIIRILKALSGKLSVFRHFLPFTSTIQVIVKNTKAIFLSFALCMIGHVLTLTCISLIAFIMYGGTAAAVAMGLSGFIIITTIIPVTPGNIGWTEWIADSFFRFFGIEGGATIFAVWRVITVLFSLIGGAIYLYIGSDSIQIDAEKL